MRPAIIFLHGLFGGLSNWEECIAYFGKEFDIYVPGLPLYDEHDQNILDYLVIKLKEYIDARNLDDLTLVGNSLGGHVAILFAYRYPEKVSKLVLTGSSGLYENYMIGSFPRRRDRNYIKRQVENVFYKPEIATDALVDEVFLTLSDNRRCFSIIKAAKTTQRNYVTDILPAIRIPVLLIWGKEDRITPPAVADQFARLLPGSSLVFLPECGHTPMMEEPKRFNELLEGFLSEA